MKEVILLGVNCIDTQLENILVDVFYTEEEYICVKKCNLSVKQAKGMREHGSEFSYSIIHDHQWKDGRPKEFRNVLLMLDYISFMDKYSFK